MGLSPPATELLRVPPPPTGPSEGAWTEQCELASRERDPELRPWDQGGFSGDGQPHTAMASHN